MTTRIGWARQLGGAAVAALLASQAAFAAPTVSVTASPNPAAVGSTVTVDVLVSGAVDLSTYQFSFAFDPSVLQVKSLAEGSFLSSVGTTFWDGGAVDNAAGTVSFAFDTLLGGGGRSGSGLLERVVFGVAGAGISAITFSDLLFLNTAGADLGALATPGSVTATGVATPVPEPSIAVLLACGLAGVALTRRRRRQRAD